MYLIHILNSFIKFFFFKLIHQVLNFIYCVFPVSKFPFTYFIFCSSSLGSSILSLKFFNMLIIVVLKFIYVHYLNLLQFVSLTLFPPLGLRNFVFVVCSVIFYLVLDSECENYSNYIIFAFGGQLGSGQIT